MQNLQGIGIFFHGFQSRPLDPKDFCMEATGTPRQSVGFPGARGVASAHQLNHGRDHIRWHLNHSMT